MARKQMIALSRSKDRGMLALLSVVIYYPLRNGHNLRVTTPLATPKLTSASALLNCFVLLSDECASLRMPRFSAPGKEFGRENRSERGGDKLGIDG